MEAPEIDGRGMTGSPVNVDSKFCFNVFTSAKSLTEYIGGFDVGDKDDRKFSWMLLLLFVRVVGAPSLGFVFERLASAYDEIFSYSSVT